MNDVPVGEVGEIVYRVFTLEISPLLARRAARTLRELGYRNVFVIAADGRRGLPRAAPFDAILLAAAPTRIPAALVDQLAEGGRMVGPVGDGFEQVLRRPDPGPLRAHDGREPLRS